MKEKIFKTYSVKEAIELVNILKKNPIVKKVWISDLWVHVIKNESCKKVFNLL